METFSENSQAHHLRGNRALSHITHICTAYPGRGSATPSEAQAAEYVRNQLLQMGITDVHLQPFQGLRSIWLFLALAFGIALVGHAAFWLLRSPVGEIPVLLISLLAFATSLFLMWRKFTFRSYPLRSALPHGPSQNVIASIPPTHLPEEDARSSQQVVLIAHLDSHRAVVWFANDFLLKMYAAISPVAISGLILAPVGYAIGTLTGLDLLLWLVVPFALLHFLAWFTGVTADLGLYTPGANDNASAVGVVLTLAERLREKPLKNTRVWLAFTGCEETGCDGILHLLTECGEQLKEALFVDLEMVGIGSQLAYIQREGLIHKTHIPTQVEKLILSAGEDFGIKPVDVGNFGAFTEMGAIWEHGYQGACLMIQKENSTGVPEWHRLTDLPDRLQTEALEKIHQYVWKLLNEIDVNNRNTK